MPERPVVFQDNGDPKRLTMGNLIDKARFDWDNAKRKEAFHTAMSGMILLSKGIAKLIHENNAIRDRLEKLERKAHPPSP